MKDIQLNTTVDNELFQQARKISGLHSERELVELSLRLLIRYGNSTVEKSQNPSLALLESNFVGCFESETTLSTDYKGEFAKFVNEKYDHC